MYLFVKSRVILRMVGKQKERLMPDTIWVYLRDFKHVVLWNHIPHTSSSSARYLHLAVSMNVAVKAVGSSVVNMVSQF